VSVQARPQDYAAAIYDLALEPWLRHLGSIQKAVQSDAALRADLDDAGLSTKEKLERLSRAMPAELSGEIRKFL
jgi:F0F1-type ATP synthase delta subunit